MGKVPLVKVRAHFEGQVDRNEELLFVLRVELGHLVHQLILVVRHVVSEKSSVLFGDYIGENDV